MSVDLELGLLRKAVSDHGHTLDSLQAHTGKDRAYIGKVLNGDKPCSLEFECALPADVRATYSAAKAEAHGAIVVTPLHGLAAQKAFVAGLVGLMSQQSVLPARGELRMAHVDEPQSAAADQKTRRDIRPETLQGASRTC